jgi:hypothetical protein
MINQYFKESTLNGNFEKEKMKEKVRELIKKDLTMNLFIEQIMEKTDLQREQLDTEEFMEIEFQIYGVPSFVISIISLISGIQFEPILYKRLKHVLSMKRKF